MIISFLIDISSSIANGQSNRVFALLYSLGIIIAAFRSSFTHLCS
jgi:hypothetical protein